jgi:hypothetical protein
MRIRKVATVAALLFLGLGAGAFLGATDAEARRACGFERCWFGYCDDNTMDPQNCSGHMPCEIEPC